MVRPVGPGPALGEIDVADDQATRITNVRQVLVGVPSGTECLVVVYGAAIGRKYDLFEDIINIGRDPDSTITLESDSVSRRHARIERYQGVRYIIDLNSTNGTYLNDTPVHPRSRLESGMLVKIGDTIFKYIAGHDIEAAYFEEIHRSAVTDGLTQIANKRALDDFLDREVSRARRHGRNLTLLMLDIDHFKQVNDVHGHLTGDVVLREIASIVRVRIRREELFARYGGEEFVILLPETDLKGGLEFAEAIREMIEGHATTFENQAIKVTVSIGVAQYSKDDHKSPDDLVKAADRKLYVAKENGRNCVRG